MIESKEHSSTYTRDLAEEHLADRLAVTQAEFETLMTGFLMQNVPPSAEQIRTASVRLGRNAYPGLVDALYLHGLLSKEAAAEVVSAAWSSAEFPQRQLPTYAWACLFERAGYTVDGVPAARPTEVLTLWRGAVVGHELGWSWTDDLDLATWFAGRTFNGGQGLVWAAEVEPTRLLAHNIEQRRGEREYVVRTEGLRVRAMRPVT